jgi:hypothetical protein
MPISSIGIIGAVNSSEVWALRGVVGDTGSGFRVRDVAALSSTDVIVSVSNDTPGTDMYLRRYTFTGSGWTQIGQPALITTAAATITSNIVKLTETSFAYHDTDNQDLITFSIAGSPGTIEQVGNAYATGSNSINMVELTETTVAIYDKVGSPSGHLQTFTFDGTDWSPTGNILDLGDTVSGVMARINSTDIFLFDGDADVLRKYRFNGTDWIQIGDGTPLVLSQGSPPTIQTFINDMVALTPTRIAAVINNTLWAFDISAGSPSEAILVDEAFTVTGTLPRITRLNSVDIAHVMYSVDDLGRYRFH